MKIRFLLLIFLCIIFTGLSCNATAELEGYITEEMEEYLPEGINDETKGIDYNAFIKRITDVIKDDAPSIAKDILSIISVIILSAVVKLFSDCMQNRGIQRMFSYLSSICVGLTVYSVLEDAWNGLSTLMSQIHSFMITLTPVTTLLYSIGGNITTATVNSAAMSLILTIFENISYYALKPVLCVCFGFSLISAISGRINLSPVSDFVRKIYTTVLVFIISTMTCILSLQHMWTSANDTLALRTVKFAAASSVPLVGGALSEASATLAVGIGAIRKSFGMLAILAIIMMVVPGLIKLVVSKLAFSLVSAMCGIFGLDKERSILRGAYELMNFAIAIVTACSVMFIINVYLLSGSVAAFGG